MFTQCDNPHNPNWETYDSHNNNNNNHVYTICNSINIYLQIFFSLVL
jgi:hypothetical protein